MAERDLGTAQRPFELSFAAIYEYLLAAFGPQHWWPADTAFEVAVGAVLTQNTAWLNVERAIQGLAEQDLLSPRAIVDADLSTLTEAIRPTGYFNVKAHRLKALCTFLLESCNGAIEHLAEEARKPEHLRQRLLAIHGVGEETADSILLYALGIPVFVVDAYTRRIFERLQLLEPGLSYAAIQDRFTAALPRQRQLYNEFHALIVALGKDYCKPRPRCPHCPLVGLCPYPDSTFWHREI